MHQIIDNLVSDFERGSMSRRQLVQALAAGVVAATAAPALAATPVATVAQRQLKAIGVNHIAYGVADYARTRDFYADLLGMEVSEDTGKQCYLGFGDTLLSARASRDPAGKPHVDHIAYSLADWDEDAVEAELQRRGLAPRPDLGGGAKSFHIRDPHGYKLQISPPLKKA